ncbi:hypothetical protein IW140_006323 [Coemansia sp. RSA 1813]|nr:hypothetical protein EV178_006446 [Coemansia sp. RSA 1646]KAJ1765954.1 hypothetical protein LPJ74_006126 [Coemansia sp. RSA 1843]KAJ2210236.1 hypothetical protein EV179_006370 [Coemansia sp. RSA 487]KAJ2562788.1 hypothetical protein IW140_006323 [Coemansia sp. RSA 1813]
MSVNFTKTAPAVAHAVAPRSMPTGQRNVVRSNDSASLWNCTLSPGWTQEEVQILRQALLRFGIGNWMKIIESECLPGKTIAQMNLQTQRMLGQQSTAEFNGLHIDALQIGEINSKKQGPEIKRKNNCIVNTGGKLTRDEIEKRRIAHREKFEVPAEVWKGIILSKQDSPHVVLERKREELKKLKAELDEVLAEIDDIEKSQQPQSGNALEDSEAISLALGTKRPRE